MEMLIKKGMSRKALLAEFTKVGIHGENQRLVQEFMTELNSVTVVGRELQQVIVTGELEWENQKYATIKSGSTHYLTGIESDDDKYFLHPLNNIPFSIEKQIEANRWGVEGNEQQFFNWLNRKEHGIPFERLQGDLLFVIGQYSQIGTCNNEVMPTFHIPIGSVGRIGSNLVGARHLPPVSISNPPKVIKDFEKDFRIFEYKDHFLAVPNWKGQHEPRMYRERLESMDLAIAANTSEVVLLHPNHKTKEVALALGECAVFTDQRGSDPVMGFD